MPAKAARPGPRYAALLQVLRTAEALWESSRVFFARWDLSPSQFNVLNLLHESPCGLSQSELSRALIMHRSNVTGLVDRLEQRGLVRRHEDPADRRAWQVALTATGRRLLGQILPAYHRAAETVWGNVSASRAQQLAADLATLSENARAVATAKPR
jgi:DNA-binding MarR family transcriptional regulator